MKAKVFVFLFLVMGLNEQVMSQSAADMAAFKQMQDGCIKELNIGTAEAALIATDKPVANPTESYKCYHNCLYKKMGMINADGKANNDAILKIITTRYAKAPVDKVKALLTSCGAAPSTNACDYAYKFEMCMINGLKA